MGPKPNVIASDPDVQRKRSWEDPDSVGRRGSNNPKPLPARPPSLQPKRLETLPIRGTGTLRTRRVFPMTASGLDETADSRQIVRFGVFELDLRAGELRKQGVKLKLQGKPLQLLIALVQRPGSVVTRDELRRQLWASDVFVDFDSSLNTAINRLRFVLGDSAETPRYVETLARTGYRFIAPIETAAPRGVAVERTPNRRG